jgi:hypothetical protein
MRISQIILPEGIKENKKLIRRKDVIKTEGRKVKKAWTMTGRKGVMQTGRKGALMRQYCEIFNFRFFSWISFSQASVYPPRAVSIFSKIRADIRSSRCTTSVVETGGKWKKSSIRKILIILFGYLWVVELTYR